MLNESLVVASAVYYSRVDESKSGVVDEIEAVRFNFRFLPLYLEPR